MKRVVEFIIPLRTLIDNQRSQWLQELFASNSTCYIWRTTAGMTIRDTRLLNCFREWIGRYPGRAFKERDRNFSTIPHAWIAVLGYGGFVRESASHF